MSFIDKRGLIIGRKYIYFLFLELNLYLSLWVCVIYILFIESLKVFEEINFGGFLIVFIVYVWILKYGYFFNFEE